LLAGSKHGPWRALFSVPQSGPKIGPIFGARNRGRFGDAPTLGVIFWVRFYYQKTGLVLGPRFPAGMDGAEGQISFTESSATHREQLYDNTTNGTLQLLRVAYTSISDTHMKTVCCFYNDQPNSSFARLVSLRLRTSAPLPTPIRKLCSIQIRAPAFVFTKAMPTKFHVFFVQPNNTSGARCLGDRGFPHHHGPAVPRCLQKRAHAHRTDPTHGYSHNGSATYTSTELA
jgi:hypothetical protein